MSTNMHDVRAIPLAAITVSTTTAQKERRAHFDKQALRELADSIKAVGVAQPILVRPVKGRRADGLNGVFFEHLGKNVFSPDEVEEIERSTFELVFGERRLLAAKLAGLEEIPATVRDLSDEQALHLQLIENLKREDLHELAEAEGYEQLAKYGHSVDEMAEQVGKSKATIYARMKLLALCPDARKAFYGGEISASVALLLARIPIEKLQKQALKEVVKGYGYDGSMSYRSALEHVQRNYMLSLARPPFPAGEENLVPGALPCGRCPKNTAAQPELFGDIKGAGAGVCTDPGCFRAKVKAAAARTAERAKENGQRVIEGAAAKKIAPYGTSSLQGGFVGLDERCYEDPKNRTYRQLLGRDFKPSLLRLTEEQQERDDETRVFLEVAERGEIAPLLKKAGISRPSQRGPSNPEQNASEKKAKAERAFRVRLFDWVLEKIPKKLDLDILRRIAKGYVSEMQQETRKQLCGIYSIEPIKRKYTQEYDGPLARWIDERTEDQIAEFLQVCYLVGDLQVSTWSDAKPERLLEAAKALKIDPTAVRREIDAAAKEKKAPPAKSKRRGKK